MNTKQLIATLAFALVASAHAATPAADSKQLANQPVEVNSAAQPDAANIEQQTKAMQDMHAKMMTAKTPEARAALMQEGMATMHNGMAMMGHLRQGMGTAMGMGSHMGGNQMGGQGKSNGMPMDCTNLNSHMHMMDAMMQLMMDLQPPTQQ
ncbi:hypothetical protein [Pseudomonas sp. TMP9]|uniref:hypothetical protein n=1 Tax=Pseudomonas sp. TMP9 TaxID=3133144 RepID=UPI0030D1FC02